MEYPLSKMRRGKRKAAVWHQIQPWETRAGAPLTPHSEHLHYRLVKFLFVALCLGIIFNPWVAWGGLHLWLPLMGVTWYSIASSDTDANSPLNQTLFDKIREDLDYLHATGSQIKFVVADPGSVGAGVDFTIDAFDYRDRQIKIDGGGFGCNNSPLLDSIKIGATDDEYMNETDWAAGTHPGGWAWYGALIHKSMYTANGSAAAARPNVVATCTASGLTFWVDSSNGYLKARTGAGTFYIYLLIQITYSEDQGGH